MTNTTPENDPTQGTNPQHVPNSADHAPDAVTPAADALHGDLARGEVYDQPAAVALPADTLIATPTDDEPDEDSEDGE